jgi:hypothetical protein
MTNATDVSARYNSEAYREHEDAIRNFKRICEERKVDYADAFLTGYMTAQEYKKVHPKLPFQGQEFDFLMMVLIWICNPPFKYLLCNVSSSSLCGDFIFPQMQVLSELEVVKHTLSLNDS